MNDKNESSVLWSGSGPLSSLAGAVVVVGASGRLSDAIVVGGCVLFVYSLAPFLLKLAEDFVPKAYASGIRLIVAVFLASAYARTAGIAWLSLVRESAPFIGMVPLCLVASGLFDRTAEGSALGALRASAAEALVLVAFAGAFALVREPIGYGTLTLPGESGPVPLFGLGGAASYALRSVSATSGGFLLLGYVAAVYRRFKFRLRGTFVCGEDER